MSSKTQNALVKKALNAPLGANFWKPEKPGDFVTGEVIGMREVTGKFGPQTIASVKTDSGVVSVSLTSILQNLFDSAEVSKGETIAIVFRGFGAKRKGMNPARLYSLAVEGRDFDVKIPEPTRKNRGKARKR